MVFVPSGLHVHWKFLKNMISRAENNGQQVNLYQTKYFLARTNPDSGWSNNEYYNIFLPKEYQIMLAIDCFYYIVIQVFDIKLMKNAFTRCRFPFRSFCMF